MQSFADVVHTLLVSIRALEARRSQSLNASGTAVYPAPTLANYLPYRCEPTQWGEPVAGSGC